MYQIRQILENHMGDLQMNLNFSAFLLDYTQRFFLKISDIVNIKSFFLIGGRWIISGIRDTFSNAVTIYAAIQTVLTASHLVFPNQSMSVIGYWLNLVNDSHLIWIALVIGISQLVWKHRKYVVSEKSGVIRLLKAFHQASLESSVLILLLVGSIFQIATLFLHPGFLIAEIIGYGLTLRVLWALKSKWAYSTVRLL